MKKLLFMLAFFTMLSCSNDEGQELATREVTTKPWLNLEEMGIPFAEDIYIYPYHEGAEFSTMSLDERIVACTIPDATVNNMSTSGLIQSFITNPQGIMAPQLSSSSPYMGFQVSKSRSENVYKAITSRDDAEEVAIHFYMGMKKTDYLWTEAIATLLQLIIADEEMTSKVSLLSISDFMSFVVNNKTVDGMAKPFMLAKLLIAAGYEPFIKEVKSNPNLALYCECQYTSPKEVFDSIDKHVKDFLEK